MQINILGNQFLNLGSFFYEKSMKNDKAIVTASVAAGALIGVAIVSAASTPLALTIGLGASV